MASAPRGGWPEPGDTQGDTGTPGWARAPSLLRGRRGPGGHHGLAVPLRLPAATSLCRDEGFCAKTASLGDTAGEPSAAPSKLPGACAGLATGAAHAGVGPLGRQRSHQRSGMEWSMDDFTSPGESLGTGTDAQCWGAQGVPQGAPWGPGGVGMAPQPRGLTV